MLWRGESVGRSLKWRSCDFELTRVSKKNNYGHRGKDKLKEERVRRRKKKRRRKRSPVRITLAVS